MDRHPARTRVLFCSIAERRDRHRVLVAPVASGRFRFQDADLDEKPGEVVDTTFETDVISPHREESGNVAIEPAACRLHARELSEMRSCD